MEEEKRGGAAISFLLSLRSSYHTFAVNFYHLFFCKMIKTFCCRSKFTGVLCHYLDLIPFSYHQKN